MSNLPGGVFWTRNRCLALVVNGRIWGTCCMRHEGRWRIEVPAGMLAGVYDTKEAAMAAMEAAYRASKEDQ